MKKTIVKLLLAITAIAAPLAAQADLIYYEGFNYPNGFVQYSSTNLWLTNSFGGGGSANDMFVNNGRLEVSATGGTVSRVNDCHRFLSVTNDSVYTNSTQVLYTSFTVVCTNLPNGAGTYFASFYASPSTGGGFYGRIFAATNGTVAAKTWRLGVSGTTSTYNHQYPVDLATNTPYQVVAQLDPVTLRSITLWVNPINSSDPSQSSSDVPSGVTAPIDAFAFRQASSFGSAFFQITNLAIATTFDDAATNIWDTNAVAPTIAYQPVGVTNFVGASVLLSGVADGQGLGNLTYQWQQNGQNYTGGNGGNASVLTISSAQLGDSGDYTLVATTPYGLSVTSTVAKVLISSQPVPPTFTTQPISQTNYTGQNVVLSASVVSPGNVTFTWYSNNVAVTAGVNSSGDSSTLEMDNAQPSFSASYKVSAVNDVNATTVFSTNAVLTVINPPSVSVAYLRSLIDPVTLVTTASPTQPYQVTGVITSYTNTTTGDTASYYLQDATAGINIFATFGSTFRPADGDVVTYVGVLSTFNANTGGLELFADTTARTYTSYTIVSNNFPLPTPRVIPFTVTNDFGYLYLNTNLQGSRVTLNNVYFGTNAGLVLSTTANVTVTVTNADGVPFALEFYDLDQDTAGQTLPVFASSVTGNLIGFHPNVFLAVTKFSDINTNISIVPIPLSFTLSAGALTLNWADPTFSLQWATNVTGPYTTIPGAATGFTTNTTDLPALFFRLSNP